MTKLFGKLIGWLIAFTIGLNYLIAFILSLVFGGDFISYSVLDIIFNHFK